MLRARVNVQGLVQGVYFRVHARNKARRLGLTGWVRNVPDGSVEAVLEGNEPSVRAMLEWCHRGSPRAKVTNVTVVWEPHTGEFDRFSVL
ncbi:MAG: acylphosphatase [Bacillota bacterium]|nr:MAG: acylphosphatase [Bacillota bacterium]